MNKFGRGSATARRESAARSMARPSTTLVAPLRLAACSCFPSGNSATSAASSTTPSRGDTRTSSSPGRTRPIISAPICAIMHQEGAIAEVVSEMEYDMARGWAFRAIRSSSTAPTSLAALERPSARAPVFADHLDEICDLEAWPTTGPASLRRASASISTPASIPQWSRFGFNLESGQALDAVKRIANGGKVAPQGAALPPGHLHRRPRGLRPADRENAPLRPRNRGQFGFAIEYFDIGGGLPSQNRLKATYLPPDVAVPAIDEFAEADQRRLLSAHAARPVPKLIIESGRAMVDESGYLITTSRPPSGFSMAPGPTSPTRASTCCSPAPGTSSASSWTGSRRHGRVQRALRPAVHEHRRDRRGAARCRR